MHHEGWVSDSGECLRKQSQANFRQTSQSMGVQSWLTTKCQCSACTTKGECLILVNEWRNKHRVNFGQTSRRVGVQPWFKKCEWGDMHLDLWSKYISRHSHFLNQDWTPTLWDVCPKLTLDSSLIHQNQTPTLRGACRTLALCSQPRSDTHTSRCLPKIGLTFVSLLVDQNQTPTLRGVCRTLAP